MNFQSPAAGEAALDVNVMVLVDRPRAINVPLISRAFPLSNFTVTPGFIVNVTPDATVTCPVIWNGLSANVHSSSDEIVPETEVPADTGEMETKARSRDRAVRTARRRGKEPSVLMAAAMNLGM
jgi:hypothetical protein